MGHKEDKGKHAMHCNQKSIVRGHHIIYQAFKLHNRGWFHPHEQKKRSQYKTA